MDMMRTLLKHLLSNFLFLFLATVPVAFAQTDFTYERDREETPSMEEMLEAREVFEYEVRYGFFTLGWVDVELLPDTTYNGEKAYHLRTTMRSNSRLPLMGTKIVNYENIFQYNEKWPYSFEFWRDDVHDEEYNSARIIFDREADAVRFYEHGEPTDTLALKEPASGGDIIFYYSRKFAGLEEEYTLPAYIEGQMGLVTSKSGPKTEMREYDAFDEPIETYRSEGIADVDGPFGFNGKFKSWFSTDDLRVPVEAHVRVIFGNVKVRLINYERREQD